MITKKFLLIFPPSESEKPIIYHLVKDYDLIINIFRAKVTPEEDGYLVIDITGEEADIEKGIEFVKGHNITINEGNRGLQWNTQKCTHCGICIPHCPTKALHVADKRTMVVDFKEEDCVECLNCIRVCPFGACTSMF